MTMNLPILILLPFICQIHVINKSTHRVKLVFSGKIRVFGDAFASSGNESRQRRERVMSDIVREGHLHNTM